MQRAFFLVSLLTLNLYSNAAVAGMKSHRNLAQVDNDSQSVKPKKAKHMRKVASNDAATKASSEAIEELDAAPANSSAANRAKQSMSLLLSFGPSLFAEYSISRDLHINLSYNYVGANLFHLSESSKLFATNIKYFVGNSFYLDGGIGYREAEKKDALDLLFNVENSFLRNTTDVGVAAGIGNQWQWSMFTLGADWLRIYQPVATLSSKTRTYDKVSRSYVDASDPSYKAGTLLTSAVYIGLSF